MQASERAGLAGLAHVATVSFVASRASPTAGFWIALAGGAALARAGQRWGARVGYGASLAAMLQTVAVMGPARFGVPFTQALTAPLLGALEARGASALGQVLACALIRLVQNAVFVAFFILVLAGGIDAYTGTYDTVARWLFLPEGAEGVLILTVLVLLAWSAFASTVQVLVYRRGLRRWPGQASARGPSQAPADADRIRGRFDPRAVAVAAAIAFGLLIASTEWALLAAVSVWLALAWVTCRPDRTVIPVGLFIAATLGLGVFAFTAIGGVGLESALRRAARATLLVLVATWLRAAAGSAGLREVSRRSLARLRRLPSVPEAAFVLDDLGSDRRLGAAARSVLDHLRSIPKRPLPVLDAVLAWVVAESARFGPALQGASPRLSARLPDAALIVLALAPVLALV